MKIVIVGGGTAGWITAAMWIKETIGHDITVVESSKIGIIGAGEGSTGSMPWFIRDKWPDNIVNEIDFLKKTKATLKMAIRMKNWKGDGTSYYSPFHGSPTDGHPIDTAMLGSILKYGRSDYASLHSWMLDDGLTTFRKVNGRIVQGFENHSYHFDGVEVGKYFKDICVKRGVKVIDSVVDDLTFDDTEFLKSVKLTNGETIEADMWFDCSGFAKVLMGKTKNKWISYKNHLPCNSAITFSDDISSKTVRFETLSETMNAGWMWKIPLQQRHGCGYVYCDEYQTYEESLAEIEAKVGRKITPLNHIKFEAGKYEKIWYKNIACIGLSGHFLEPLQATSINSTIVQMNLLKAQFIRTSISNTKNDINRNKYNEHIGNMVDDFKDLIQMQYMTDREDTEFWKYCKYELPKTDFVKYILDASKYRTIGSLDFKEYFGGAGWAVWGWTLAGLNHLSIDNAIAGLNVFDAYQLSEKRYDRNLFNAKVGSIKYLKSKDFMKALIDKKIK